MLILEIPEMETFDDNTQQFISIPATKLYLEHSLLSISKWEAAWKKPFLKRKQQFTVEEYIDYIKCMTVRGEYEHSIYYYIVTNKDLFAKIISYINDPMSATTFNDKDSHGRKSTQIVTSELIYYWMLQLNIPVEFQKWHLNRLLTLIKICEIKNKPGKKMSATNIKAYNRQLNEHRKAMLGTTG